MEILGNIISSNCVGARLYKMYGVEYPNPFCWCQIKIDDFEKLVKNYNNINFSKCVFSLEDNARLKKQNTWCVIDDTVTIHYIHYIQDETYDTPTKEFSVSDTDIFYKDMLGYTKEKYYTRLKRMNDINKKPFFIFSFNYIYNSFTKEEYNKMLERLYELSKHEKIMVIMNNDSEIYLKWKEYINKNFTILGLTREECKLFAKSDYEKILKHINEFNTEL